MDFKKKSLKNVKIMFAMGGSEYAPNFSAIFANSMTRKAFSGSCLEFITKYGFDGINIDWHFPRIDGEKNDKNNFVTILLFSELGYCPFISFEFSGWKPLVLGSFVL